MERVKRKFMGFTVPLFGIPKHSEIETCSQCKATATKDNMFLIEHVKKFKPVRKYWLCRTCKEKMYKREIKQNDLLNLDQKLELEKWNKANL